MSTLNISVVILLVLWGSMVLAEEKSVMTFNAGLFEAIGLGVVSHPPSRVDRRDAIIRELKNPANDADVICLQEVFVGEDVEEIKEELATAYPYSFSELHDEDGNLPLSGLDTTPACGDWWYQGFVFSYFVSCFEDYCNHIQSVGEVIDCIGANCSGWFALLSQECTNCLIMTGTDDDKISQKCYEPMSASPDLYRNMNKGGLVLLSKTSMENTAYVDYHPDAKEFTGHYSYLKAEVDGIGTVVCTHVTTQHSGEYPEYLIYWQEDINTFEEQTAAELGKLVTNFGSTSPVILLGDFNVCNATAPDNYQLLTAVFQTNIHDECTFCDATENAYNGVSPSRTIDHIFFNDVTYKAKSSTRLFDTATVGGYPISDHFGLKQTFRV